MTSAECSNDRRNAISAATAKIRTTTAAKPARAVQETRLKRRVNTWLRRRSLTATRLQPVSHAANRLDRRRPPPKAELLAQVVDVDVLVIRLGVELVIPHRLGDARARHRAPGVAHEELEERELAG